MSGKLLSLVKLTEEEKDILERKLGLKHTEKPLNTGRTNYPPQPQNMGRTSYPQQPQNTGRTNYPPQPQNTSRINYPPQPTGVYQPPKSDGKLKTGIILFIILSLCGILLILLKVNENNKSGLKSSDNTSNSSSSVAVIPHTVVTEAPTTITEEPTVAAVSRDTFTVNNSLTFNRNTNNKIRIGFYLKRLSTGNFARIRYRIEYNTEVFTLNENSISYYNIATDNHYENKQTAYGMEVAIGSAVDGVVYNFDNQEPFVEMEFTVKDSNSIIEDNYIISACCLDLYDIDGNSVATAEEKNSYDLFTYIADVS